MVLFGSVPQVSCCRELGALDGLPPTSFLYFPPSPPPAPRGALGASTRMPAIMRARNHAHGEAPPGSQAGYEHYELSNYALPGHQCRHNLTYWSGSRPFYGFGLGAASCLEGRRASRPRTMDRYRCAIAGSSRRVVYLTVSQRCHPHQ